MTTSARWPRDESGQVIRPESTLNVAFTYGGLKALGVPPRSLASFAPEFRQGMLARAALNHDTGASDPSRWDTPWQSGQVHALLSLYANDPASLEAQASRVGRAQAESDGVAEVGRQDAARLVIDGKVSNREHFGYRDGLSNPDVAGTGVPSPPGDGKLLASGGWSPLEAGEFLFGQPDEAGETPDAPIPVQFARNGTYLVYRKLHQNVASFRRYLREQGGRYPGGPDLLAAKFLGRWWDGTPLVKSPDRMDPTAPKSHRRRTTASSTPTTPSAPAVRSPPTSAGATRGTPTASAGPSPTATA